MFKHIPSFTLVFFLTIAIKPIHAIDESFPFDKPCLTYNKEIFKEGGRLLDIMKEGDFPQYCTLYSLSGYIVNEKRESGYFIIGSKEETKVFLRTKSNSKEKSAGEWAYFVGPDKFLMTKGVEKEFYVFEEFVHPLNKIVK